MGTDKQKTNRLLQLGAFFLVLMLAGAQLAFAQRPKKETLSEESSSYITKTNEGYTVSQNIVFPEVPNALRYEIEIEQQSGAGYEPFLRLETTENRFEVSLHTGNYRYRVSAFNRMDLLDGISDWQSFEIRTAIAPAIETYQPFYGFYYEMKEEFGVITITGWDFSSESEFALVKHYRHPDWSGLTLEGRKDVKFPEQVIITGSSAILHFGPKKIKRGNYDIFVRNPGGLWDVLGQVRVGSKQYIDIPVSGGYLPNFALWDKRADDSDLGWFNPLGFYVRGGFIPFKTKFGNIGLDIFLNLLTGDSANYKSITIFNLVFQIPVSERVQHNIRLGVGLGEHFSDYIDTLHLDRDKATFFDLGYSVQYFVWKNLFIDFNLDFALSVNLQSGITGNRPKHLFIRPGIGLGWQIGRWAEWAEVAEGRKRGEDYSVPVSDKPRPEWALSLGWAPMIPLVGIGKKAYITSPPGFNGTEMLGIFNAGGGGFRFAYIPFHWGKNKLGVDIDLTLLSHKNLFSIDDSFEAIGGLISDITVGIRYQRVFTDHWQLNLRGGIGLISPYAYYLESSKPKIAGTPLAFGLKGGASAQFFFWKNAYVEAGADLALGMIFKGAAVEGVDKGVRLYLKPNIGIGWQINQNAEKGLRLPGWGFPKPGGRAGKARVTKGTAAAATPEETVVTAEQSQEETSTVGKEPQEKPTRNTSAPNTSLLSLGGGLFFDSRFGGRIENPSSSSWNILFGGGADAFFDIKYAELDLGIIYFGGKHKEEIGGLLNKEKLEQIRFTISLLGKYPFSLNDKFSISPLLGIEYNYRFFTKREGVKESIPPKAGHTLYARLGGGFDYSISNRLFFRLEALYGIQIPIEKAPPGAKHIPYHSIKVKTMLGWRL